MAIIGSTLSLLTLHKKGMFFTLISMLIVGILVLSFSSRIDTPLNARMPVIERRVTTVNAFVQNIEHVYLERLLRMYTVTAIKENIGILKTNKGFIPPEEFEWRFNKTIIERLIPKLDELNNLAKEELHITAVFTPIYARVYQDNTTGPWIIGADLITGLFVDGEIAIWNLTAVITTRINVQGLEDPLYAANNSVNFIKMQPFKENWTINNFRQHIYNQTYKYEPRAPSYIMRFVGNFSDSTCCGIESMVNLNKLTELGNRNATFVDYCYFGDVCIGGDYGKFIWTLDGVSAESMPEDDKKDEIFYKFKLDSYHTGVYNLTQYPKNICEYDGTRKEWKGSGCI